MDDIVRKDIPPETPNDRLTTPHLPARDPKDQVEQPDTRGRALTHAQHQSHGGQPNSPRHHQQIGASRLSQAHAQRYFCSSDATAARDRNCEGADTITVKPCISSRTRCSTAR